MVVKPTLVLEYSEESNGKNSFNFYVGKANGERYGTGGLLPYFVYVERSVKEKNKFAIVKKDIFERESTIGSEEIKEQALSRAYQEALDLKESILREKHFLVQEKCIDKTGFVKLAKLEQVVKT